MKNLKKIIDKFPKARILVVGDLILDEYIWGDVQRISPEAPVPVVWANNRTYVPGGAANVASNLRSLGAGASLTGIVGKDHNRDILLSQLHKQKIDTKAIFTENKRHTTLKSRIFARNQQVVRVDWEHVNRIHRVTESRLFKFIFKNIKEFDAVIIEDYGKGLFNINLLTAIISCVRQAKKIITVDPREDNFEQYFGVTAITPNLKETENAVRYLKMIDRENKFNVYKDKLTSTKDMITAGNEILKHLNLECLLMTLGEAGMYVFQKEKKEEYIPTQAQEVFDVSGAGDTVIASFTLSLACGASKLQAAHIANFAAGIVVNKIGTATVSRKELLSRIKNTERKLLGQA